MADSRDQDLHEANVLEWTVYKRRLYPTFFGAGPPELQLRKIEESCLQHAKALRTKHNADPDPRLVADPWFNNKQNPFVSKAIDEAKQQAHARAAEIDGAIQDALTVVRDEANKVCPVEAQLRAQIVENKRKAFDAIKETIEVPQQADHEFAGDCKGACNEACGSTETRLVVSANNPSSKPMQTADNHSIEAAVDQALQSFFEVSDETILISAEQAARISENRRRALERKRRLQQTFAVPKYKVC